MKRIIAVLLTGFPIFATAQSTASLGEIEAPMQFQLLVGRELDAGSASSQVLAFSARSSGHLGGSLTLSFGHVHQEPGVGEPSLKTYGWFTGDTYRVALMATADWPIHFPADIALEPLVTIGLMPYVLQVSQFVDANGASSGPSRYTEPVRPFIGTGLALRWRHVVVEYRNCLLITGSGFPQYAPLTVGWRF